MQMDGAREARGSPNEISVSIKPGVRLGRGADAVSAFFQFHGINLARTAQVGTEDEPLKRCVGFKRMVMLGYHPSARK